MRNLDDFSLNVISHRSAEAALERAGISAPASVTSRKRNRPDINATRRFTVKTEMQELSSDAPDTFVEYPAVNRTQGLTDLANYPVAELFNVVT
ncbi:hypothetical protein [Mesorhizobium sp.]|uniref:hypothetical protein n=1 Tax=Mesorhizobium sp. TaxID=1871066 RepID=UPI000FE88A99|nr:hypothetical protein [Mesorhizobium sp.]RWB69696.1 MAG: hypothetical protein EOQ49_19640 [Mesorhizobium sp.]